ncbi:MAG: recombinase family protein [Clostridiales bacterium]|nr:recombinase family protein [Clostridiales bacterium]
MAYCMYLRKSRADLQAEAMGEGETLARHEQLLSELAHRNNLELTQIYREVVSGETISDRPAVQALLREVEAGRYQGVLVMEVERLARGDTMDQGRIAQSFKYSATKIITPMKTYDPADPSDEEYFEFGLFMSRREYKTINRRLQNGKLASVRQGKYCGSTAPYGYRRVPVPGDKGFTLTPLDEEAETVRFIFQAFTGTPPLSGWQPRLGIAEIVQALNQSGIPSRTGRPWSASTVRGILSNPVYIGKLRWKWRPSEKQMEAGRLHTSRPRNPDCMLVDGMHPGIIAPDVWQQAQPVPPSQQKKSAARRRVQNPLAGLIRCGLCGRPMQRRPFGAGQPDALVCATSGCPNVSASLSLVEARLLDAIGSWCEGIQISAGRPPENDTPLDNARQYRLSALQRQMERLYDLVEQEIYTREEFLHRKHRLDEQIEVFKQQQSASSQRNMQARKQKESLPAADTLDIPALYQKLDTPKQKNAMLKTILHHADYLRTEGGRWHQNKDDFTLHIYMKLPRRDSLP